MSSLESLDFGFFAMNMPASAVLGAVVGFAAKKLAKIVALLVGVQTAFLGWLETQGIVTVNWDKFSASVNNGVETAPNLLDMMMSTGALGASFAGGFALGFKKA